MITIISPAKTLDLSATETEAVDKPKFYKEAGNLSQILKTHSAKDLMKLMSVSEKLANLNYERFQNFSSRYTDNNSKAALLTFKGDVYLGLDAASLSAKDMNFAQDHLRILSGMYGILKPLDKMQPYRLEMGTKLKNPAGKDLYEFWGDQITKALNRELGKQKTKVLVNLASKEYYQVLQEKNIKAEIIHVHFRENRDGKLKFLSFNAKKARGLMSRYIITNKVDDLEGLKAFDLENYYFEESLSDKNNYYFIR